MFGVDRGTQPGNRYLNIQETRQQAEVYSTSDPSRVVPVTVHEDPAGPLTGWLKTGADTPIWIQKNHTFGMQFPNGVRFAEAAGHGVSVRLRAESAASK